MVYVFQIMDKYTFTIYFSVLFFSSFFSLGVSHSKSKSEEFIGRFFLFISLLIPAILRYGLGADYTSYESMYYNNEYRKEYAEIGFNFVCNFFQFFELSSWWMFFSFSFITYFILSFFVKKKNLVYIIVFYILFSGYFRSLDQIRQSLALPFILLAIDAFMQKEIIKTYFYILIGALFHTSSVIFALLLPICSIHLSTKARFLIIIGGAFGIFTLNLSETLTTLIMVIYPRYAMLMDRGVGSFGSGFGFIANTLFPFIFLLGKSDKRAIVVRENHIEKNFAMIYILLFFLTAQIAIFNRLRDLLWVVILYTIPKIPKSKYRTVIYCIIFSMGFLVFFRSIQVQHGSGTNQISPYVTIFEK